ncbi:MAG: hypothetical protein LUH05_05815 [Candidatus Gastranaerophilales bacterium]|nr:hypothetical protein [Candidatus Gastranaerophilales bacterium]
MGLDINYINNTTQTKSVIDSEALARVKQQILNPDNTINTNKLDLSKFNRVSLGTDLYSSKTNSETALQASKAATDFGINFSEAFSSNVQYLNSQAAQSLFTAKENNGTAAISIENTKTDTEEQVIIAASQVAETQDMKNDRKGSNPFSFYLPSDTSEGTDESDFDTDSINIFA